MTEYLTTLDHIDRFLDDTKNQSLLAAEQVRDFLLDLRLMLTVAADDVPACHWTFPKAPRLSDDG